ncbi:MAG: DUF4134 domain-containing protein [Bacteroidia bacterium]|nr:DUF4134 domain-containing protein [Bacteroidia bacterium]
MQHARIFTRVSICLSLLLLAGTTTVMAQNDVSGALDNVNNTLKSYVAPILSMAYPIAAIIFIVGAIKVYRKFTNGDPDVAMTAFQLIGGAIFIGLLPTLLSAFFGI